MIFDIAPAVSIEHEWDFTRMQRSAFDDAFRTRYIWERNQIINGERQFYTDPKKHAFDPFSLDDAGLTITARKRKTHNESFTTQEYLSGVISTYQRPGTLPDVTAGPRRVSALLAMPVGGGVWPAWWFNPENAGDFYKRYPVLPEIDVVEYKGEGGKYYSTVHSRDNPTAVLNEDQYAHNCPDLPLTDYYWFHMERDERFVKIGFQDQWVKQLRTPNDLKGPLHWNLNLAIGGTWPERCSGQPMLQEYTFRCAKIVMSVPEESAVVPQEHPNYDIIARLDEIRSDRLGDCRSALNQWIEDLSR